MRNDYYTLNQWDDIFSFWFLLFVLSNSGKLFILPSSKRPFAKVKLRFAFVGARIDVEDEWHRIQ